MEKFKQSLFQEYFLENSYDEMLLDSLELKEGWSPLMGNIQRLGLNEFNNRQGDIYWNLAENGVTYNVYNDPKGMSRPWELNNMPSILTEEEWVHIEKGIQQRAELFNLILEDLYGPRELIKKGIVPQEVIYSHRGFLRPCDQIKTALEKKLLLYGADLARGQDGRIWVISDRTQAPSGMGYALENRMTMRRVLPELFEGQNVRYLAPFFKKLKQTLLRSCPKNGVKPNIVLLTPGPHNETYFEHAYLASYLGISLVQGNDLVVRNEHLFLKSIKGLQKVDVILRRVDDLYADPLELYEDSHLGVPGLLNVVRRGNVAILNPLGSRVLENPGLIPFMQNISKYFLGEPLVLPQIASWWCGQEKEKDFVLSNIAKLNVKRIDDITSDNQFIGQSLSKEEQENLLDKLKKRPYQYVAQEKIALSSTPHFHNKKFFQTNVLWRTYAIADGQKYSVMPGGLARITSTQASRQFSALHAGQSRDLWVVQKKEIDEKEAQSINQMRSNYLTGLEDLPSMTAENLFWAGRYVARSLITARYLRMILNQMNYSGFGEKKTNATLLSTLFRSVTTLTQSYPGFFEKEKPVDAKKEIFSIILDIERPGSLSYTLQLFAGSFYSIRNIWSQDMWHVFESINTLWNEFRAEKAPSTRDTIKTLDKLITSLIAFKGLIEESILMNQGLLIYFLGMHLESSNLAIAKWRSLLAVKSDEDTEYDILEALLSSQESLNIYRHSFRSYIKIENVMELILLDEEYPRSLAHRLKQLYNLLRKLPQEKQTPLLRDFEKHAFAAYSKLKLSNPESLAKTNEAKLIREDLESLMKELSDLLFKSSLSLSNTFFSHTYQQNQSLLGAQYE